MRMYLRRTCVLVLVILSSCAKAYVDRESSLSTGFPFEIEIERLGTKVAVDETLYMEWQDGDQIILFHAPAGTKDYIYDGLFKAVGDGPSVTFIGMLSEELLGSSYDWYAYTNRNILQGRNNDISSPDRCSAEVGVNNCFTNDETTSCIGSFPLAGRVLSVPSYTKPHFKMEEISSLVRFQIKNGLSYPLRIREASLISQQDISGVFSVDITGSTVSFRELSYAYAYGPKVAKQVASTIREVLPGETISFYTNVKPFVAEKDSRLVMQVLAINNGLQEESINLVKDGFSFDAGEVNTLYFTYTKLPSDSPSIEFADWRVEQICVDNFDANLDGKLSYEEAASIKELPTHFFSTYWDYAQQITTFDELQYFTSLEIIGYGAFEGCSALKRIVIPNSVREINDLAFGGTTGLETINLPSSLQSIGVQAFNQCGAFFGNLILPENLVKIGQAGFYKTNITSVTANAGLEEIGMLAFAHCEKLQSVSFGNSLKHLGSAAFLDCTSLENLGPFPETLVSIGDEAYGDPFSNTPLLGSFSGKGSSSDGSLLFLDEVLYSYAHGNPSKKIIVPDGIKTINPNALCDGTYEEVVLPNGLEVIDSESFINSDLLTEIILPQTVQHIGRSAFANCNSLSTVHAKCLIPPNIITETISESSIESVFQGSPVSTIYVPTVSVDYYKADWEMYDNLIKPYEYDDVIIPPDWAGVYYSTDYSHDGEITVLQKASEGHGIDIVIMGDCFSDREIADGTYRSNIEKAIDEFFNEEPYSSFRNLFNVYMVTVVSQKEGYWAPGMPNGRLETYFGNGTRVGGNNARVREFALQAISEDRIDDALLVVIMNREYYAGTCYMYLLSEGNYGRGMSVSYFPLGTYDSMIGQLILHETGGHGFAKLADEYYYTDSIPEDEKESIKAMQNYGSYPNIDFTSNPTAVRWSRFLADTRYSAERLGVYEGGATYKYGVYRPSENSIMRNNTGGYNAPSRYAIWYRIHKLAYGESWEGTYEDFVAYDAINRTPAAAAARRRKARLADPALPPLAPPVIIEVKP